MTTITYAEPALYHENPPPHGANWSSPTTADVTLEFGRFRVVLRRHGNNAETGKLALADLELDDEAHEVRRHGHVVELTNTEYRLLRYLLINAGRVLTRSQILDHVWHYDFGGDASVLETYISYLRRKVDRYDPPLVQTVRGVGYVLRTPRK